ncbi:hypothetical protein ACIRPQ_04395 [Streptomyces sp. NPDC101213]|uniref:hypothetical protein n=1 Tax=Streptomyces sp. NPDC101213 TaxID=3366130 RepID=UPI0037F94D1D
MSSNSKREFGVVGTVLNRTPTDPVGVLSALTVLDASPSLLPCSPTRWVARRHGSSGRPGRPPGWLPVIGYVDAMIPASAGRSRVWAWAVQRGDRLRSWAAADTAFVLGTALFAARGARQEAAPR